MKTQSNFEKAYGKATIAARALADAMYALVGPGRYTCEAEKASTSLFGQAASTGKPIDAVPAHLVSEVKKAIKTGYNVAMNSQNAEGAKCVAVAASNLEQLL